MTATGALLEPNSGRAILYSLRVAVASSRAESSSRPARRSACTTTHARSWRMSPPAPFSSRFAARPPARCGPAVGFFEPADVQTHFDNAPATEPAVSVACDLLARVKARCPSCFRRAECCFIAQSNTRGRARMAARSAARVGCEYRPRPAPSRADISWRSRPACRHRGVLLSHFCNRLRVCVSHEVGTSFQPGPGLFRNTLALRPHPWRSRGPPARASSQTPTEFDSCTRPRALRVGSADCGVANSPARRIWTK